MKKNNDLSKGIKHMVECVQILIGQQAKWEVIENIREGIASIKVAGKLLNPDTIEKLKELEQSLHNIEVIQCIMCQDRSHCFRLNCGHLFCESCLTKSFVSIDSTNYPNCKFKCPACYAVHNPQDMQRICNTLWKTVLSDARSFRESNNHAFNCAECHQQKSFNYFPEVSLCSTHKTCKECLAANHRNSSRQCEICRKMFNEIIVEEQGVCMGCNEYVYYVGDYLTSVCGNHYHCYNCLQKLKENNCCLVCCNQITENEIEKINKILVVNCACCYQAKPSLLFVNKTCCEYPVCSLCQTKAGYKCKACDADLGLFAIELIEEVREQVEKMNLCIDNKSKN